MRRQQRLSCYYSTILTTCSDRSVVAALPRAAYATAVETLAGSVVRALTGGDDAFRLADQLTTSESGKAGLAAVRVLGSDVLAPFVLGGHRFSDEDGEVVAASIRTFPLSEPAHDTTPVRALRDWATGQVLTRLGVDGFAQPYPADRRISREQGWVTWTGTLGRLAPLAFPGLDCPVHADARRHRLDIARGATRAVLRRDYLTAARLARWLAVSGDAPMVPPFPLEPVLRQLKLVADPDTTRLLLEIILARHHTETPQQ